MRRLSTVTLPGPDRRTLQEAVRPLHVVSSDELRGSVGVTLRISDKSIITQEIVMDAACPYLRFNTEVPPARSSGTL